VRVITISFEQTDEPPRLIVTELIPHPLASVWVAQTEGLYVQRWWAPSNYENVEVDLSATPGGAWRIVQRDPDGNQFSFYGKVEQVEPEKRLVISIISELYPDNPILLSQEFLARGPATAVVSTYEFDSDNALATYVSLGGMDRLRDASARLDALLAQLAS
jgi:uncharacterized protein YndB with AHSA1/START domain